MLNRPILPISLAAALLGGIATVALAQQQQQQRPTQEQPQRPATPLRGAETPAQQQPGSPPRGTAETPAQQQPGTPPRGTAETPAQQRPGTPPRGTAETPAQQRPGTPPRGTAETPAQQRPGTPPRGTAETPAQQQPGTPPRGTAETPARQQPGTPPRGTADAPQQRPGTGSAQVTQEQKTVFREKLIEGKAAPQVSADINISVGARVPQSVRVQPLPAEIVTVVPHYRGYSYFRRGDDIVIVEPRTQEVVEVVATAATGDRLTTGSISLSPQQRTTFRQRIVEKRSVSKIKVDFRIAVGERVPERVQLVPLPDDVIEIVPRFRGFMYFVTDDGQIVIVEPQKHEIVEVVTVAS